MPDVSERIRHISKPVEAPKPAAARKPGGFVRAVRATSRRTVAGAALAAMMIGIVVNAVAFQHGRRAELGLIPDPTPVAAIPPPLAAKPKPKPTEVAEAVPEPPSRAPAAPVAKSSDAIADFLKTSAPDKRKLTVAAQGALAKLGFDVKANGSLDADTRDALREFEKAHHLPASTEITARLVHTLKTAAAAN